MARAGLSRGDLLLLAAVLAAAGAVVSAYLTFEWYVSFTSTFCDISSYLSCSAVGTSSYAAIDGIPTATVGLAGFLILFGLAFAAFRGHARLGPWSTDAWTVLVASLGALTGLGLTLIEIFVIEHICILCAAGFALDLGILAVAVVLWKRV